MASITRRRRTELKAALAELAEGCTKPADVARRLAEAGCKGTRDDCFGCPIAVWLLRKLAGPGLKVTVAEETVRATWGAPATSATRAVPEYESDVSVELPPVLTLFVMALDEQGMFPELDAAGTSKPPDDGHFEVYPVSGSCAFDRKPHGHLGREEAMDAAQAASRVGPGHCVEQVTASGTRIPVAEYRNGNRVSIAMPPGSANSRKII